MHARESLLVDVMSYAEQYMFVRQAKQYKYLKGNSDAE